MTAQNVLLVTIDCWRHDALVEMDGLRSLTDGPDWQVGDVMTMGAATNAAFPAILGSAPPTRVYVEGGAIEPDYVSLPDRLSAAGYDTAGFVASNPFLGKWSGRFETFWNDGMRAEGVDENRASDTTVRKVWRRLTFTPRLADDTVLERARQWWVKTASPRFLWVHLMGPHGPYLPGLNGGLRCGPLGSYLALARMAQTNGRGLSDRALARLRRLYDACLGTLDRILTPWLDAFSDGTTVLVTGDHGEEFSTEKVGHARLYDDTVRVPLVTNVGREVPDRWRQLDVAPTVCEWTEVDPPASWEGQPATSDVVPQPMMGIDTDTGRKYLGIRSADEKEIRTFDWEGEHVQTERFDLAADPDENAPDASISGDLIRQLDEFASRPDVQRRFEVQRAHGLGDDVSERLSDLGYR